MLPTQGLGLEVDPSITPDPTFFSTKIVPVLNANITTITTLELEDCNLKPMDVGALSTFVKKNKLLGVLNLSQNELFDTDCGDGNHAAKLLAKAMKNHPEPYQMRALAVTNLIITLRMKPSRSYSMGVKESRTS